MGNNYVHANSRRRGFVSGQEMSRHPLTPPPAPDSTLTFRVGPTLILIWRRTGLPGRHFRTGGCGVQVVEGMFPYCWSPLQSMCFGSPSWWNWHSCASAKMIVLGNGDETCFLAIATECVHVFEYPKDHANGHMIKRQTVTLDPMGFVVDGEAVEQFHLPAVLFPLTLSLHTHSQTECNDSILNPLNAELNPICYLLALLDHHFLHVSRIRVKLLTLRLLMLYIYGAPILDVSRSHTTTQHSR